MIFSINEESIATCITIFFIIFIRTIYVAIRNKKKFPNQLFEGKFLLLFFAKILVGISCCVFTLFFSNNFFYMGLFYSWLLIILIAYSLYFVLWVIFFMHGYDVRYQFKKVIAPSPLTFLEFVIILSTAIFTLNYICIGLSILYFVITYAWDYKGYQLTKPKIPDHVVIRENDEP